MKSTHAISLLVIAGLAIGAAIWASSGSGTPASKAPSSAPAADAAGQRRFLPALAGRVNDIASIVIKTADNEFTAAREGDAWVVKDKANYPAKPDVVRQVVLGLAELRELEPMTSRPEMYSKLGVEDPAPPASGADVGTPQSLLVTLKDSAGAPLAEVIIGTRRPGSSASTTGTYVRRKGEAQSWLCEGSVEAPRDAMAWLDSQFANIERTRLESVDVTPAGATDAQVIRLGRGVPAEPFKLLNMPEGKELKEAGLPETIAGSLTFASFSDVAPLASVDFSGGPDAKVGQKAQFRAFDGLVIDLTTVPKDAKTWWKIVAGVNDARAREYAAKPDASKAKPGETPPAPTAEQIEAAVKKLTDEAAKLNASWSRFAYAVQDFKAKPLNTTLADMLKDPAPPAPAPTQAPPTIPGMPKP